MMLSLARRSSDMMSVHFVISRDSQGILYGKGSIGISFKIFFHILEIVTILWQFLLSINLFLLIFRVTRSPSFMKFMDL